MNSLQEKSGKNQNSTFREHVEYSFWVKAGRLRHSFTADFKQITHCTVKISAQFDDHIGINPLELIAAVTIEVSPLEVQCEFPYKSRVMAT